MPTATTAPAFRPELYRTGWDYTLAARRERGLDVPAPRVNLLRIPADLPEIGDFGEASVRMNGHLMRGTVTGYRARVDGTVYAETRQHDAFCDDRCRACQDGEDLPDW